MFLVKIYKQLEILSALSILIPIICCLIRIKTLNTILRVLFVYVIICAITEGLNWLFADMSSSYYSIVQNTFTLVECLLLATIYYIEFTNPFAKKIVLGAIVLYFLISFLVLFIYQSHTKVNNIITIAESCLMISLSVAFFYKVHTELNIPKLKEHYFFWLNTAISLYFFTTSIMFAFNGYLENCKLESFQKLYSLHLLMNIIYNSLLAVSVWKARKT